MFYSLVLTAAFELLHSQYKLSSAYLLSIIISHANFFKRYNLHNIVCTFQLAYNWKNVCNHRSETTYMFAGKWDRSKLSRKFYFANYFFTCCNEHHGNIDSHPILCRILCRIVINIEFLIIRNIRLEDIRSKTQNVCGFRFIAINLVCDSCRLHHFASRDAKAVAF